MGLDSRLDRTDRKTQEKIRELGGVAQIDNPLREVVIPLAKERMYETGEKAVKELKSDHHYSRTQWLDRTPKKEPARRTLNNIAERIVFEELVKEGAKQYQRFAGEKVGYTLEDIQTPEQD